MRSSVFLFVRSGNSKCKLVLFSKYTVIFFFNRKIWQHWAHIFKVANITLNMSEQNIQALKNSLKDIAKAHTETILLLASRED